MSGVRQSLYIWTEMDMTRLNPCTVRSALFAALLWFICGTTAAELAPGETLPTLSLPDQHDQMHAIGDKTKIILFAADRPASDLLNGFLKAQVGSFLESRNAAYIADISSMPSIITRLVALPRMRDRPYRILLVEDPAQTAFLPRQEGAVTIVRLTNLRVDAVEFVTDPETLAAALTPQ